MILSDFAILAIHFAGCFYMTGVILVIQFIHYPCFAQIERSKFAQFHNGHSNALGWIAGPAMIVELLSALYIAREASSLAILNLCAVLLLWGITFLVSVPAHNRLARGFEEQAWHRLIGTNWFRTALWGLRSCSFLGWILLHGTSA